MQTPSGIAFAQEYDLDILQSMKNWADNACMSLQNERLGADTLTSEALDADVQVFSTLSTTLTDLINSR